MRLATAKNKVGSNKKKKGIGFGQLINVANSNTRCDELYHGHGWRPRIASRSHLRKGAEIEF
jgi:hypothetical protein